MLQRPHVVRSEDARSRSTPFKIRLPNYPSMIRVSFCRFCIASVLTASSWAADSIAIVNPSFEANNPGGVGYGTPDGWTGVGGVGVDNGGQPFADNGSIPDRGQIGFIQ